jgi:hypothetical protein
MSDQESTSESSVEPPESAHSTERRGIVFGKDQTAEQMAQAMNELWDEMYGKEEDGD